MISVFCHIHIEIYCARFEAMPSQTLDMQAKKINKGEFPVFVKFYDFPIKVQKSRHAEFLVASAAIKVVGAEAFRGLMICEFSGNPGERPGLWKLFLWNEVARAKLISEGIVLEGIAIEIFSNFPVEESK